MTSITYTYFDGEWVNDKPNGYGTLYEMGQSTGEGTIDKITKGYFVDGLMNGEMSASIFSDETEFKSTFMADMGDAPDISADYAHLNLDFGASETKIIYAVYSAEGSDMYWWSYKGPDDLLAAIGFDDN